MSNISSNLGTMSATVFAAVACATAHAGYNFNTCPAPGGFVQVGAAPSSPGANPWPGSDFAGVYGGAGSDFHENAYTGNSSASLDAAYSSGSTTNGAHGNAGQGYASLSAHNSAPNNSFFAQAGANGGWTETFIINSPGLTGMSGFMQFTVRVQGTLAASGFAGASFITVTGYKDGAQLMVNPLSNPGNSDLLSTDRQYGHWAVATYGNPPTDGKTVDGTITFAVPFTFGTQFKLGIYAHAGAGMRSSSGVAGNSTADTVFADGVTWNGISNIYLSGTPIPTYTITSGTGINWAGPISPPSPADLNGDGVVDGADLGTLLGSWGPCSGCPADLNGDGVVDGADLGTLLGEWTS